MVRRHDEVTRVFDCPESAGWQAPHGAGPVVFFDDRCADEVDPEPIHRFGADAEAVRFEPVVAVEESDVGSAGNVEPPVARGGNTARNRVLQKRESWQNRAERLDDVFDVFV